MVIRILNRGAVCQAREGEPLLSALAREGIVLSAPCGGRGLCEKCRVRLVTGELRGAVPDSQGIFLACRGIPLTDIAIELLSGDALPQTEADHPDRLPDCSPVRTGAALDVGTTTVSIRFVDLDNGRVLETVSALNDQRVFGADVMNRINAAQNGKTGELFTLINRQTQELLSRFMRQRRIDKIETLAVSGNPAMLHLFTNTDPSSMGEAPFTPVFLESRQFSGEELGLSAGQVILTPSIAAFIGGDITAGLAALDITQESGSALLVDIGTNGEMALFHQGRILCCSTAAGPALEGAEISCGMGSVPGAINAVGRKDGKLSFTTIGGGEPRGLCGCGLIDVIAFMLKEGIIDETGAMDGAYPDGFPLTGTTRLLNRDVRQYQLAKSAILSGIRILCRQAGLAPADLNTIYIAGGLGFFINKENAIATGLLPGEFRDKIAVCGNLSLRGAVDCLLKPDFLDICDRIISMSGYADLAADPAFMDEFADNMLFY
jgi:uncharacterized 2Fe-2S/4Fe-4S cluster protein (DUF4445 family)